jgi:uncharacterized protein
MRFIDMDTHFAPRNEYAYMPDDLKRLAPIWVQDTQGREVLVTPAQPPRRRSPSFIPHHRMEGDHDVAARLRDMDEIGVEMHLLTPQFNSFSYELEPRLMTAMAHSANEAVGQVLKAHPDRFAASAIIPTQDVRASVDEAEHALELGFQTLFMKTPQGGVNLDNPRFWPLYEYANRNRMPICLHSANNDLGSAVESERLGQDWGFAMGSMCDYLVNLCALIYGGVFDAYPDLKFSFSEVGATWLPWLWDQLDLITDHKVTRRNTGRTEKHPTEYLTTNVYVLAEPTEKALGWVCEHLTSKNLLIGTDYPHRSDLNRMKADIDLLLEREDISQEAKEDMLYRNALEFLGGRVK